MYVVYEYVFMRQHTYTYVCVRVYAGMGFLCRLRYKYVSQYLCVSVYLKLCVITFTSVYICVDVCLWVFVFVYLANAGRIYPGVQFQ